MSVITKADECLSVALKAISDAIRALRQIEDEEAPGWDEFTEEHQQEILDAVRELRDIRMKLR